LDVHCPNWDIRRKAFEPETIKPVAIQKNEAMADPRLYEGGTFVVLESGQPEQFLTSDELLAKLQLLLAERQADLPRDLQRFPSIPEQAAYLLETSCEFDLDPGQFLQWYVVRLEK
jgi:hypothetical protein